MEIRIIGIPSYAGGLYSGTEICPQALREAGIVKLLEEKGISVCDLGDIELSACMPRHNVPPVRNWPGPKVVWDEISKASKGLFGPGEFVLILGGDCSIVTGTINGLHNLYKDRTYLLCLDAHLDAVKPGPERCIGAAGMGLWFLCNENLLTMKPEGFDGSHINVIGSQYEYDETYGMSLHSLNVLRRDGIRQSVSRVLSALPGDAKVMVHLDLDVIIKDEFHAVYSPSDEGLSFEETRILLSEIIRDERVIGMEVAEFSGLRDLDGSQAVKLAGLLSEVIAAKKILS